MSKKKKKRISLVPIIITVLMIFIIVAVGICFGKLFINRDSAQKLEAESLEKESLNKTEEPTTTPVTDSGITGEAPYLVKVNRAANCVTIYAKDATGNYNTPIKAMVCSTGKKEGDTPTGTFTTSDKYDWRQMVDGSYAQYAYRICDEIMFHSVPYFREKYDRLETEEYNKLGTACSLGCIRLAVRDVKWIYDNCPVGTTVIIYDDLNNPGPLGKPESIKIPESSEFAGWDPTDVNEDNPWLTCAPRIINAVDITIKTGTAIDLLQHVTAADTCGNDISDKITLSGNYDTNTPGIYEITYTVTDLLKRTTAVTAWLTVTDYDVNAVNLQPISPTTDYEDDDDDDDWEDNNWNNNWNDWDNQATEPATEAPSEQAAEAPSEQTTEAPSENNNNGDNNGDSNNGDNDGDNNNGDNNNGDNNGDNDNGDNNGDNNNGDNNGDNNNGDNGGDNNNGDNHDDNNGGDNNNGDNSGDNSGDNNNDHNNRNN